ncbi:hypothetical protein PG995_005372 [Apiospora arundinis]
MAASDSTRFTSQVLAVISSRPHRDRYDILQKNPEQTIHQLVTMDASYDPAASILFRFTAPVSDEVLYVQILPDHVESLTRTPCDDPRSTPELDVVRKQLGTLRLLSLHFQLGEPSQFITPMSFEADLSDTNSDTESLHTYRSMAALASALDFSVYMRHNALTKLKFTVFHDAIHEPRNATQVAALEWRADPSRLYNGRGGVIKRQGVEGSASSTASYASTIATDSPPGYDRLLDHDHDPDDDEPARLPAYHQVHQPMDSRAEDYGKRARSSSGGTDSRPWKKDKIPRPFGPDSSPSRPQDTLQRQIQELGVMVENRISCLLAPYETRIGQLEAAVRDLQEQNSSLREQLEQHKVDSGRRLELVQEGQDRFEERQGGFEDKQAELENRQESVEETAELVDVRLDRLEGVLDEEDWKEALVEEVRYEAVEQVVSESVDRIRESLRNA